MRCISVCGEGAKGMKKKGTHLCTLACAFCGRAHRFCLHEARKLLTGRVVEVLWGVGIRELDGV